MRTDLQAANARLRLQVKRLAADVRSLEDQLRDRTAQLAKADEQIADLRAALRQSTAAHRN